jgi:hypothetical protein
MSSLYMKVADIVLLQYNHSDMFLLDYGPGSTQPLTEMSTGNLRGCKGRRRLRNSLEAILESFV